MNHYLSGSVIFCVLSEMDTEGKPLQTEIVCLYTEKLEYNPSPLYPDFYYVQEK